MAAPQKRESPVYKTLNRPLTIMGVERTLFATAFFTAAGIQVLFTGPWRTIGAVLTFAILLYFARLATHKDPKMLVFVIQAIFGQFRTEYDPCKYTPLIVRRISRRA
jgi:type IV secretory pathway VirB3-like protein